VLKCVSIEASELVWGLGLGLKFNLPHTLLHKVGVRQAIRRFQRRIQESGRILFSSARFKPILEIETGNVCGYQDLSLAKSSGLLSFKSGRLFLLAFIVSFLLLFRLRF
jgi:hypothetical protein